jgi:hypothetical protein
MIILFKKVNMLIKYKMTAVIPVIQYGNIQPSIEIEGDDYDKLEEEALNHIKGIWDKYAEKPFPQDKTIKEDISNKNWKKFTTFTSEVVWYNPILHKYVDEKGNPLISGSAYAHKDEKPFDVKLLAPKVAVSNKITTDEVCKVWEENGNVSKDFGTIVHKAMQFWFDNKNAQCGEKEYNTPNHPFLRNIVQTFPNKNVNGIAEVMVSDVSKFRVGQIDLLEVKGDKIGVIHDYKTDAPKKIKGNLENYWIQLNYYANILIAHGWTIEKLKIWHLAEKGWILFEKEPWILDEDVIVTNPNID